MEPRDRIPAGGNLLRGGNTFGSLKTEFLPPKYFLHAKMLLLPTSWFLLKNKQIHQGIENMLPKPTALDTSEFIPPQMNCKSFMDLHRAAAFVLL